MVELWKYPPCHIPHCIRIVPFFSLILWLLIIINNILMLHDVYVCLFQCIYFLIFTTFPLNKQVGHYLSAYINIYSYFHDFNALREHTIEYKGCKQPWRLSTIIHAQCRNFLLQQKPDIESPCLATTIGMSRSITKGHGH